METVRRRRRFSRPEREQPLPPPSTPEPTGGLTQDQLFKIAILLTSYRNGVPFEQVFASWEDEELNSIIDLAALQSGKGYWGLTKEGQPRRKPGRRRGG